MQSETDSPFPNRRPVVVPSPIHTTFSTLSLLNPQKNHNTPTNTTTTTTTTTPTATHNTTTNTIPISIPPTPQPNSSLSSGPSSAKAFLMAMGMTSPVGIQGQEQRQTNTTTGHWLSSSQNSSLSFSSPNNQLSRTRSWNVVNPTRRQKSASSTSSAFSAGTPFTKSRTNSISESCHSPSSQSSQPQSPAASFLSSFTEINPTRSPHSGEEGEEVGGYVLGKVLGRGMFSVVRKAFTMRDQLDKINVVAVKIVKKEADTTETNTPTANSAGAEPSSSPSLSDNLLDREIDIWRQLDHPHLLRMIEVVDHPRATFLFCDYCPGGDMLTHLRQKGNPGLPEPEAARLWTQLASAVLYLHEILRVVHRDIKLENILLSETGDVKLGDFGFADYVHQNDRLAAIPVTMGSLAYCAPELVRREKSSSAVSSASIPTKLRASDCWALGVILFAFITGSLPFADEFEPRMVLKISNVQYAWSSSPTNMPQALSASIASPSASSSDTAPSASSIPSVASEHSNTSSGMEAPSAPPTPLPRLQGFPQLPGGKTTSCSNSSPMSPSSSSAASSSFSSDLSGCSSFSSAPSTLISRSATSPRLVDRHSCRTDPKSMGSPLVRSLVAGLFNIKWRERWTVRMSLESSWVRNYRESGLRTD